MMNNYAWIKLYACIINTSYKLQLLFTNKRLAKNEKIKHFPFLLAPYAVRIQNKLIFITESFFCECIKKKNNACTSAVFREKNWLRYYYTPEEWKKKKTLLSTPTSFEFWKTTGSKTKSGNIKTVKPQDKVIKNVSSGQVV